MVLIKMSDVFISQNIVGNPGTIKMFQKEC